MEQRVFKGTWEAIPTHASELSGQRVRLTIVDPATATQSSTMTLGRVLKLAETLDFVGAKPPQNQVLKQTLDKLLAGRVGTVDFQPSNLSEQSGEAFGDILNSKYNSLGLSS